MGLRDFTVADIITRNALAFADQLAFVGDGERLTHRQYAARVDAVAANLANQGLAMGDRLAILAQNSLHYVVLYGAAARLGAIVVPINWRLSADEISHVVNDTTPKMMFVGEDFRETVAAQRAKFSCVERFYSLSKASTGFESFAELLQARAAAPERDITADTGFVIIHTAAVGGRPRGALLSHGNMIAANMQALPCWEFNSGDVHLAVLPLFHIAALSPLLAVQQMGGANVIMPRFDIGAVLKAIEEEKVSFFLEFPPMLGGLLDQAAKDGIKMASLRHVGGLDVPETITRFEAACPQARFWVLYGQTECGGIATVAPFRDRPGSAGKVAALSQVAVVDDLDQPLPIGQTGEIVVRGPLVFQGYWKCDADNEFTFRNGWHHTGDMGRFDANGFLWYAGRSPAKELIKPGGENVYPAEVEKALLEHPAIAEAMVFGVPDAQWGEAIKAVCVLRAGQKATAAEVIEFVGGRIARYKKPKHVVFAAALPKNDAGAIDRAKVKQEFATA